MEIENMLMLLVSCELSVLFADNSLYARTDNNYKFQFLMQSFVLWVIILLIYLILLGFANYLLRLLL